MSSCSLIQMYRVVKSKPHVRWSRDTDSLSYDYIDGHIILNATINKRPVKLAFDTGSSRLSMDNEHISGIKNLGLQIIQINGRKTFVTLFKTNSLSLGPTRYTPVFGTALPWPEYYCTFNGIFGGNLILTHNWRITDQQIYVSKKPFASSEKSLRIPFYILSGAMYTKSLTIGNMKLNNCVIDYGIGGDIMLSYKQYNKFVQNVEVNDQIQRITSLVDIRGKIVPDTITILNCNMVLEGHRVDSVYVWFHHNPVADRNIGTGLLRRFTENIINPENHEILLQYPIRPARSPIGRKYSFVLRDRLYFLALTPLPDSLGLRFGDTFTEINGVKSQSFSDHCEFEQWMNSLDKEEYLNLIDSKGNEIRIPYYIEGKNQK